MTVVRQKSYDLSGSDRAMHFELPKLHENRPACAIVFANGSVEESVDGAGVRILLEMNRLLQYIRGFLETGLEEVRFIWFDDDVRWLSVFLRSGIDARGTEYAAVELDQRQAAFDLTRREIDVLTLVAGGLSNDQVSACLAISPRTIAKHIENILGKMNLSSRAAAAGAAVDLGILRLPTPGGRPLMSLKIGRVEVASSGTQARQRGITRPTKRPILVGSPRMSIGPGSFDAEEMERGAELAVAELNAAGGIDGRRLEIMQIECDINDPQSLERAYERFLGAEVDAIATGYSGAEARLQDLVAEYGCPYLHASTNESLVKRVREDPDRFSNVFQVCPSDINYGPGLADFVADLELTRQWTPRNRLVLTLSTKWMGSDIGVAEMEPMLDRRRWQLKVVDDLPPDNTDWASALDLVHRYDPAVVFVGLPFPEALISFQRAFTSNPSNALVYYAYGPSIPVFRETLGDLAEGVIWSTTTGSSSDAIGGGFARRYRERFGLAPGRSHAGIAYDRIKILANAWAHTGNPRAFKRVNEDLRTSVYRGVNGAYYFGTVGQSALAYGSTSQDLSLSQAHLVFQIQQKRQRILSPAPFVGSSFQLPWWFSETAGK